MLLEQIASVVVIMANCIVSPSLGQQRAWTWTHYSIYPAVLPVVQTTPSTSGAPTTPACRVYGNGELRRIMRRAGAPIDDERAAATMREAATQFPDLSRSQRYVKPAEEYQCDAACKRRELQLRRLWSALNSDPPPLHDEPEAAARRLRQPVTQPPVLVHDFCVWCTRKPYGKPPLRAAVQRGSNANTDPFYANTNTVGMFDGYNDMHFRRQKRSDDEDNVPGDTYMLHCTKAGVVDGEVKLCSSCRAIRQLPDDFFPRVLNEVVCRQEQCTNGVGRCEQRMLPTVVLRNVGTANCQHWRRHELLVRTCCDCAVDAGHWISQYLT